MDFSFERRRACARFRSASFLRREVFRQASVAQWRRDGGLPDEVVKAFVNLDFKGFGVIHRRGHEFYDLFAQVARARGLSRASGAALPFHTDFLQLRILEAFASAGRTAPYPRGIPEDGKACVRPLRFRSPARGRIPWAWKTAVSLRDDTLVLNGVKSLVNNGEYAPALLVAAVDEEASAESGEPPALSLWLHSSRPGRDSRGAEDKIGQSMLPFGAFFSTTWSDDPSSSRRCQSFPAVQNSSEFGRVFVCATALGQAQAAMEDAVRWAQTRSAFGAPIASFQQIQQMLTDMEVKLANMRNLVYQAAWEFDRGGTTSTNRSHDEALRSRYGHGGGKRRHAQIPGGRGYSIARARLFDLAGLSRFSDSRRNRPDDHGPYPPLR